MELQSPVLLLNSEEKQRKDTVNNYLLFKAKGGKNPLSFQLLKYSFCHFPNLYQFISKTETSFKKYQCMMSNRSHMGAKYINTPQYIDTMNLITSWSISRVSHQRSSMIANLFISLSFPR